MWKTLLWFFLWIMTLVGWYGLVFGSNFVFGSDTRFLATLSDNIYPDIPGLSSTVIIFQSKTDISSFSVQSLCSIESKFLTQAQGLYFFQVDYANASKCSNGNIYLENAGQKYIGTMHDLIIKNSVNKLNTYLDYSSADLTTIASNLTPIIKKNSIFKNYNGVNITENYSFLKGQRTYNESLVEQDIIQKILKAREKKYISPIPGEPIPEAVNKIPNTWRPYRAQYTDGIHHGWDVYAPLYTDIVALDDGIVVRVVNNFQESDFSRVDYSKNMSDEQKLKNLDILRGNQVWLKTMKGEVIFYSHLASVPENIQEWMIVTSGTIVWKVGVSGVPESDYKDFHVHFPIMKNPYNAPKAGSYDFWDYMSWDWQTKGMSIQQTLEAQKNIFQ